MNESKVSCILAIIGVLLFTALLISKFISSTAYVVLLSILVLVCLAIHGFSRLRELDLKNLKMTLNRIEEVKAEVFAKEKDVHNVSFQIAKIIAFNSAFAGRLESEETHRLKKKWCQQKISELLSMTAFSGDVKDNLFKYYKTLEVLDNLKGQEDEREKHYEKMLDMIRKDVGEKPKIS